jgi:monooxygenase
VAGKIPVRVDGELIDWHEHFYYKACMFSNVPNFSAVFGYLNASWTLRADIVSEYVCRVLNHMRDTGTTVATPALADPSSLEEENVFDFSSGYIQRSLHIMPKSTVALPWRLSQNYVQDRIDMRTGPITDGVLSFSNAQARVATAPAELEAAE